MAGTGNLAGAGVGRRDDCLDPAGSRVSPAPGDAAFRRTPDERLHCRYQIHTDADSARFTLFHTPEDLDALLTEAKRWASPAPSAYTRSCTASPNSDRSEMIHTILDKMVNTILSCESFAGRRWRREMYGLTFFFAATPLAAETAAE